MGWLAVDLNGTLAEYHGWQNDGSIGSPVPAMVERVKAWLAEGKDVRIFTARVSVNGQWSEESGQVEDRALAVGQRHLIERWCEDHLGQRLPVTCEKDFLMEELWDDRCIQVERNTGSPVAERLDQAHRGEVERLESHVRTMAEILHQAGIGWTAVRSHPPHEYREE